MSTRNHQRKGKSTTAQKRPGPASPSPLHGLLPGEQHPGQTTGSGRLHDQPGSQIERERHTYGGSTTPKRGAGRTNKKAVSRGRRKQ